jgi:hypothetical protein
MWQTETVDVPYSLDLKNPPRKGFILVKSRMKKIRRCEQGYCRCKMPGTTGFYSVVANRAQMCSAACQEENNLAADCHSLESKFESGLPRGYSSCGNPRYTWERLSRGYSCRGKLWYWSAVCHKRVKPTTSHFTSTVPLFARLNKCKTYTRRIV